jgi:hypothetical protein
MAKIHLCLVSGQPIPNLIPLRMNTLAPDKVILLVSSDMTAEAARMKRVISGWGIGVDEKPVEPYNLDEARNTFFDVLAELDGEDVTLNITGGTKIMALAAFEVFREERRRIIYTDTQEKRILVLSPQAGIIPFQDVIKVSPYLASYGQNIIDHRKVRDIIHLHRPFMDTLVKNIEQYSDGIRILNRYMVPHRKTRTFPLHIPVGEDLLNPGFQELLGLCNEKGLITVTKEGSLVLPDLAVVEFLSGGWLEEYVFDVASSLSLTDLMMSVNVEWDQKGSKNPKNEYDVVFTHENKLYLVECKTKRFLGQDRNDGNDDTIYKLESLKEAAGGLYGKGMLVSYQKLTDAQKRRLAANRLEFCDGPALKNLKEKVKQWIK